MQITLTIPDQIYYHLEQSALQQQQSLDEFGYQLKAGHKEIKKLPLPYRAKGSIVTLIKNN